MLELGQSLLKTTFVARNKIANLLACKFIKEICAGEFKYLLECLIIVLVITL